MRSRRQDTGTREDGGMTEPTGDLKHLLRDHLQKTRADLIWKLDGLSERQARLPRTPTGNNLLGIVKHCLNIEAGYFGPTFGREFPSPDELVPMDAYDDDPQSDWYATRDETKDGLIDLYRRVAAFADETIEQLPLDAPGKVPWWPPTAGEVTLGRIIIHVSYDVARHAGHADVLREMHDGAIGWHPQSPNVPADEDWPAYVAKLTDLADSFE